MPVHVLERDAQYVHNHCSRYLSRANEDRRHDFGQFSANDWRANLCESWRFPIVDSHYDESLGVEASYGFNEVTFVYYVPSAPPPQRVELVGTFAPLHERIALEPLEGTGWHTVTLRLRRGEVHTYKYFVDGQLVLDPINPQRVRLDSGEEWSRFFTWQCLVPVTFERWEQALLERLTDHILPFRTPGAQRFLDLYVKMLDADARAAQFPHAHRLEQSVGVVNYIDKLLAREESHHRESYKTCLHILAGMLRRRYPDTPLAELPREAFISLYDALAASGSRTVQDWDYGRYGDPAYFLKLLRRHTVTGAFSHPKYGGNVGAVGWAFLEEHFRDPETGETLFHWRRSMEPPLGLSQSYLG